MKHIKIIIKIPQSSQVWMKCKEELRNGAKRISNTLSEYRKLRRGNSPKEPAASMALPLNRLARPETAGRGDTIVEVMMSLVILSMILATVYSMGARSLRVGTESNQRTEALSSAQQQIDLLVDAKTNDPNFPATYKVDQAYCLKVQPDPADSTKTIVVKDSSAQSNANKLCSNYNGTQYGVGVSYSSNVFTITAQWPSNDAPNGIANLNLYYKLPGVYKKAYVTAGSASASGTSATINGIVNPNGSLVTDCYFNYETNPDHKYTSAQRVGCSVSPGAGTTPVNVFANLSGLNASSTYFFQLCAVSLNGTACSVNNGTFTTAALPSFVNLSAAAESPSGNNAVLSAQVNPNGSNITDCHFEWGTTTSYGSSKSCGGVIGGGTSFVPVSTNAAPLTKGLTYHFRVVATNSVGTQASPDATFVPSLPPAPTESLTADSGSSPLTYGGSTTLRWTSTNATACNGNGFSTGSRVSGSAPVGPLYTTTSYTVTCSGGGGTTTSTPATTVTVSTPPPPPPPSQVTFCGVYWGSYSCVGPFGPGQCTWVEVCGIQNDSTTYVIVENINVAVYDSVHFTYDNNVCQNINATGYYWILGSMSSFKVGESC